MACDVMSWGQILEASGAALATASPAMVVPAPGLFSTMTAWPIMVDIFAATARPSTSEMPPAAKPTTILIGRLGYAGCAWAAPERMSDAMKANSGRAGMIFSLEPDRPDAKANRRRRQPGRPLERVGGSRPWGRRQ